MAEITTCITTWNEEKNIERCITSVRQYVDEIVVVDMSTDKSDLTAKRAKKLGASVHRHMYTGFVEPARNFAISKATGKWILILDADEEIPMTLGKQLRELTRTNCVGYLIPRKNIIFGKWIRHSRMWPDNLLRFFKKGSISWPSEIHKQPSITNPEELGTLPSQEENAILHHHYQTISQFVDRLNRYTNFQSEGLIANDYKFSGLDLISKPANEFFSRYYFGEGYKDGIHGLALGLLQSFSELVLYLKMWEKASHFSDRPELNKSLVEKQIAQSIKDWRHWSGFSGNLTQKILSKLP